MRARVRGDFWKTSVSSVSVCLNSCASLPLRLLNILSSSLLREYSP